MSEVEEGKLSVPFVFPYIYWRNLRSYLDMAMAELIDATSETSGAGEEGGAPPFPLHVQVSGLDDERANELGQFVAALVQSLANSLDLAALEKIWLTNCYREAVASIDRGFDASEQLAPTNEVFATGVAMVVHVKRGDEFKCQVVVELGLAGSALYAEDEATRTMAIATLVHELAHVHDFGAQCRMMPQIMFKSIPNSLSAWLYRVIGGVWSEYFACWYAAPIDEATLGPLVETFLKALDSFPEIVRQEIIAYRTSADIDHLIKVVENRYGALFRFAGYVIGHLEGVKVSLAEARPDDWAKIQACGFVPTWEALTSALHKMHDAYPNWSGLEAYDDVGNVFCTFLRERGIDLQSRDQGFHINVPVTRDTIPPYAIGAFDLWMSLQGI